MAKLRRKGYPERPPSPRPKKPLKGKGRPSSEKSTKKAKVFHTMTVDGKDIKVGGTWYQSPHRRAAYVTG